MLVNSLIDYLSIILTTPDSFSDLESSFSWFHHFCEIPDSINPRASLRVSSVMILMKISLCEATCMMTSFFFLCHFFIVPFDLYYHFSLYSINFELSSMSSSLQSTDNSSHQKNGWWRQRTVGGHLCFGAFLYKVFSLQLFRLSPLLFFSPKQHLSSSYNVKVLTMEGIKLE